MNDRDKMREEIAKTLFDWIDDDGWEWYEVDKEVRDHYRGKVDSILSLLDAQRCEWTHNAEYYPNLYHTACGKVLSEDSLEQRPFCPCCGRRVKIKEDTNV